MAEKSRQFSLFHKKLSSIFLKTKAYAFRMIFLNPDDSVCSTFRIRHYDYQCQGVELITSILRAKLEKKKLQALQKIKKYSSRVIRRSKSENKNKPQLRSNRPMSKDTGVNTSGSFARMSSAHKSSQFTSKKHELNEIFMRVKFMASMLTNPLDQTTSSYQNSSRKSIPKKSIHNKIQQLELNMKQLLQLKDKGFFTSNQSTASQSMKKNKNIERARNVRVQRFDIFM